MNLELLDEIMRGYGYDQSGLIGMLQDIQREEKYLPQMDLRMLAERIGVPASHAYALATFYKSFSLKPRGKHLVHVCLGTACHVRGGARIMERMSGELRLKPGETTPDRHFSLEPVRCFGCCGQAPVVVVDEDFHGEMTQAKIPKLLKRYR